MKSNIGLIIQREINERVRKKSFIIVTILMPLLMALLMVAPALILMFSTSETKVVQVVDKSGLIMPCLESNDEVIYVECEYALDSARVKCTSDYGILFIPENVITNPNGMKLYTNEASSMSTETDMTRQIKGIIENEKLKEFNIDNLNEILDAVHTDVSIQTLDNSSEGDENTTSSFVAYIIGMALGLVLYIFVLLYGQMVMTSVIEEKNNRVLEVMVSSVKPFDLMLGKILGVGGVALIQLLIWGVLLMVVSSIIPLMLPDSVVESMAAVNAGNTDAVAEGMDVDFLRGFSMITDVWYIGKLVGFLIIFMLGGFFVYAALYAAVGASVDNIQDASQLQSIVTCPIILAIIAETTVMADPLGPIAFWTSIIPFTSPIVMMARIPYGIPSWEIWLSIVVLYASFIGIVWFSAKIYRVGIFMYGKKPTLKEWIKWMRYK